MSSMKETDEVMIVRSRDFDKKIPRRANKIWQTNHCQQEVLSPNTA